METASESEKKETLEPQRSETFNKPPKTKEKKEKKDIKKKSASGNVAKKENQDEDWDVAMEKPPISSDETADIWNVLTKITVAVISVSLFFVVLISTGLTRVIIHLMIWKLNPPNPSSTVQLNTLGGLLELVEERYFVNCSSECDSGYVRKNDLPNSWKCFTITNSTSCKLLEDIPTVNVWWIWGLIIIISVPDVYSLILAFWRICFKETAEFSKGMLLISIVVETLHSIGLCLLVFFVLPAFDPISASSISFLVIFVPLLLSLISEFKFSQIAKTPNKIGAKDVTDSQKNANSRQNQGKERQRKRDFFFYKVTQLIGIFFLFGSIAVGIIYIIQNTNEEKATLCILFSISIILVSVVYWENFLIFSSTESKDVNTKLDTKRNTNSESSRKTDKNPDPNENTNTNQEQSKDEKTKSEPSKDTNTSTKPQNAGKPKLSLKQFLEQYINSRREKVSIVTAFWKVILTIGIPYFIFTTRSTDGPFDLKVAKAISFQGSAKINTLTGEVVLESHGYSSFGCQSNDIVLLIVVCLILGLISFKSARFACRVYLQIWCFSLPLTLSLLATPLVFIPIMKFPLQLTLQECSIVQPLWELTFKDPGEIWQVLVVGFLGFCSCVLLTLYIWTNNGSKLLKCDRLFRKPPYCGIFLDLSLLLTRCKDRSEQTEEEIDLERDGCKSQRKSEEYCVPSVYFCATMWHETESEMTQLFKSIFRVDYEQYLHRQHEEKMKKHKKGYTNEDIYEFEVHIFFDDAFKPRTGKNGKPVKGIRVNEYVKTLENVIPETAKSVYGGYELEKVKKFETPYGARFEWNLLTDQPLVVHLKDKTKIRNRKRWSQVMYLYYLLSFKLNEVREKVQESLPTLTENAFILALDGDVDFKPEAVSLLLDRMKKNPLVGAACGRIHPIGAGPMVWYQKFEYAISHWLQKAAEHVFGCVLCSPGCFSLFRGSALLADNVMKTYTRKPSEAAHYVQYDQGEDRWLCTLLLKQKYRVDYCAASDAFTFAPEGFYEFYKQRRRWAPSTMANILDLLLDGNNVRKNNQNISRPYIFYHICLFISSILTPGTIFLLILGAIVTAFPTIEPWVALLFNGLPLAIFIISIFLAKEDTQLLLAAIFSTIYSLVMLVVLIGLLIEGIESQFCSVTTVFFCVVAGVFIVAAIMHPMEFSCILHGVLYFLAVPSMSMLLIFYSVGNMHNVNWGTREKKVDKNDDSSARNVQKQFLGQSCSIGDWCRCILCVTEKKDDPVVSDETDTDEEEQVKDEPGDEKETKNSKTKEEDEKKDSKDSDKEKEAKAKKDKADSPGDQIESTEDKANKKSKNKLNLTEKKEKKRPGIFAECEPIGEKEQDFWTRFIKKYLKPEKQLNESKREELQGELIDLRNKVFFFYFITNAIFVTVVYVLTQVNARENTLSIPLPCNVGDKQGTIEPISIAFTLVFGILLLVQFFGMLIHRISTISHIIATTKIFGSKPDTKKPFVKIEKPTTFQDDTRTPDRKTTPGRTAKQRWNAVGIGLQVLYGKRKVSTKTIRDLKTSIQEKLNTIPENTEEVDKIVSGYSDEPVVKTSIRNPRSGGFPKLKPIMQIIEESNNDKPGPSSS